MSRFDKDLGGCLVQFVGLVFVILVVIKIGQALGILQ